MLIEYFKGYSGKKIFFQIIFFWIWSNCWPHMIIHIPYIGTQAHSQNAIKYLLKIRTFITITAANAECCSMQNKTCTLYTIGQTTWPASRKHKTPKLWLFLLPLLSLRQLRNLAWLFVTHGTIHSAPLVIMGNKIWIS